MKKYEYLVFDVDDTLLDFYAAFRHAQEMTSRLFGTECTEAFRKADEKCGWRAWIESGLERTDDEEIQKKYHDIYYRQLKLHYEYLAEELGAKCDPAAAAETYLEAIEASRVPMEPHTLETYKRLSEKYRLCLATNGISRTQRARTEAFMPYTYRLFVSEETGAIKPDKKFFDVILKELGCDPGKCLMIGDSVRNDMTGAIKAGMDVCLYDPKGKNRDFDGARRIESITELEKALCG